MICALYGSEMDYDTKHTAWSSMMGSRERLGGIERALLISILVSDVNDGKCLVEK